MSDLFSGMYFHLARFLYIRALALGASRPSCTALRPCPALTGVLLPVQSESIVLMVCGLCIYVYIALSVIFRSPGQCLGGLPTSRRRRTSQCDYVSSPTRNFPFLSRGLRSTIGGPRSSLRPSMQ